ncbi:MraY family glycosyltransferase [Halomonas sp. CH40]
MVVTPFLPFFALIVSSLAIYLLRYPASYLGLTDKPGGRKQHQGIIPLTGGLGVFCSFFLIQPWLSIDLIEFLPFYLGALLLLICGVIDDARDMQSTVKLAIQVLAALIMVLWGGQQLTYLGQFPYFGIISLGWFAIPFTVVAVTGLINAINMMDGVDGLAGGSTLSILAWLAVIASLQSQLQLFSMILVLGAAIIGFLLFNMRHPWRRKASVFMGDAGSMALGFAIAWFVIALSQSEQSVLSPIAYGWILALPVMDTISLMFRRLRKGRSPFSADREHLHHIFLRAGFSPGQTSLILMILVASLGGAGVSFSLAGVPDLLLLVGLLAVIAIHDVFIRHAWLTSKALRRLHLAILGREKQARPQRLLLRLQNRPYVGSKRYYVAMVGAYIMVATMALDGRIALIGLAILLVAAFVCWPVLWRDMTRLSIFWVSLLLTAYLVLRMLLADTSQQGAWWPYLGLSGLVSLPVAWWLAQMRMHWFWLFTVWVGGGAVAFMLNADWSQLSRGVFAAPNAWGNPGRVGFLTSVGLIMLLAMLLSSLQRVGRGWRPVYQTMAIVILIIPGVMILMGTGYVTAWLATLVGSISLLMLTLLLGKHAQMAPRFVSPSRFAPMVVLLLLAFGMLSHYWITRNPLSFVETVLPPLEAIGMFLRGEVEQAHLVHAGTVERLMLWQQAWQTWQLNWLFGAGDVVAGKEGAWLIGYQAYQSFLVNVIAGTGLVGASGFIAIIVLPWLSLGWVLLNRVWRPAWVTGLLSCQVAVLVLCMFSMPARFLEPLVFLILLNAAAQVAIFQRNWSQSSTP